MKYKFLFYLLFLALFSCQDVNYSKENHLRTIRIDESLYVETYNVYNGGVTGGTVETTYLTDSIAFRKYLGKAMDYELIYTFIFQQKMVLVVKINTENYKVKKSEIYDISELKEEGKFE